MPKKKRSKSTLTFKDLPGDKSITHRLLLLASLSTEKSTILFPNCGFDVLATKNCLKKLGIKIYESKNKQKIEVIGLDYKEGKKPIYHDLTLDCKNSGTTIRHLVAILSSTKFPITITGDVSLKKRPMDRIVDPLVKLGANIKYLGKNKTAPIYITPTLQGLRDGNVELKVASAQVKSALLFYALVNQKKITLTGKIQSRDHTEKLFQFLNLPLKLNRKKITFIPQYNPIPSFHLKVPADPSSFLYYIFLFSLLKKPGSSLELKNVYFNPYRCHSWNLLLNAGFNLKWQIEKQRHFEELGTLTFTQSANQGEKFNLKKKDHPFVIDEIPLLMAWSLFLKRTSTFHEEAELKYKESDRLQELKLLFFYFGLKKNWKEDKIKKTIRIIPIQSISDIKPSTTIKFKSNDHRILMLYHCFHIIKNKKHRVSRDALTWISISNPKWADHLSKILN